MPIHLLAPEVAAKIAAGEVIERPASVAKELLENAIDASANDIRIEIVQGGRALVRVSDNGGGIPSSEVELAFARHATSKLISADDLYCVRTLGFRGEALASIASVSRLTLSTRTQDEDIGTQVRYEGGERIHGAPFGRTVGTTIQVENLFFNTPARLKFLRSDPTEASHIARLVTSYALAFPAIRFYLEHNGRQVLRTLGTGQLRDCIIALFGLDVAEQMLPLNAAAPEIDVTFEGYISAPSLHRANRTDLVLFVNSRWVQDSALTFAICEGYRTLLPNGRYPMAIIKINLPPEEVDVNIHPTKREVRFRRARELMGALQRAVRTQLMSLHPVPAVNANLESVAQWQRRQSLLNAGSLPLDLGSSPFQVDTPRSSSLPQWQNPEPAPERLPMLRVVGQIAQTYVITEGPGGMYLIDQHAAAERIRYEELQAQLRQNRVVSQELLDPLPLEFSPQQAMMLEEHLAEIALFGFELLPFGGQTVLVKRIPAIMNILEVRAALVEMLDTAQNPEHKLTWQEQALITLACHTAVRAGQSLALEEMRELVRRLEGTQLPHSCPHGRPTMVHLSRAQLEKEFARR